ncbi:carboxymuconolactone decarboxylase family protein [Calidifontibacter sp. DB0510]|uniref:Carboxymuconolactone decarboxylase family protein n=1 Tax=Metallococcus carri TaxID=1656884 RepID=A0A967EA65_9MICO|nr:carboxymuconolactone decarboxylase family protein [Metallococcus carri]NHN57137.1 carboxymuconolactone decarboxylase family protein [Metallococcus carri]NOP38994.1 carboxymuconolactone decarboxylase family protein [Calidifontibacter sp. DB2511S]
MSRIPLDCSSRFGRFTAWASRRMYGQDLDPAQAIAHHPAVALSTALHETTVRSWHRLPPTLQALATMLPSARIGCSWCIDFGYYVSHHQGVPVRKLEDVANWRESPAYDETERAVLEYAEAMTETPPTVTDELMLRLRSHLDDAQIVELTALVALENQRSRTNAALGLTSQGFKESCALPAVPA